MVSNLPNNRGAYSSQQPSEQQQQAANNETIPIKHSHHFSIFHGCWNTNISSKFIRIIAAIGIVVFHVVTLGIPLLIHHTCYHDLCSTGLSHVPTKKELQYMRRQAKQLPKDVRFAEERRKDSPEDTPPPHPSPDPQDSLPQPHRFQVDRRDPLEDPDSGDFFNAMFAEESAPAVSQEEVPVPPIPADNAPLPFNPVEDQPAVHAQPNPLPQQDTSTPFQDLPAPLSPDHISPRVSPQETPSPSAIVDSIDDSLEQQQMLHSLETIQEELQQMQADFENHKAPAVAYQLEQKFGPDGQFLGAGNPNKNFSVSFPLSLTSYAREELKGFMKPIPEGAPASKDIKAAATQAQIAALDKDFLLCQVRGDGMCFFRAFIVSWLTSLARKAAMGNPNAFIEASQLVYSQKDFINSSPEAAALTKQTAEIILKAGNLNLTDMMTQITLDSTQMQPLIQFFRKFSAHTYVSQLDSELITAEMVACDNDFMAEILPKLQNNPQCASLLIQELNRSEAATNLASSIDREEFLLAVVKHPNRWFQKPPSATTSFVFNMMQQADAFADHTIQASANNVLQILQQDPQLKIALDNFNPIHSPGNLFCFVHTYSPLLKSKSALSICQQFAKDYETKCIRGLTRDLNSLHLLSLYPQETAGSLTPPSLERAQILSSIYHHMCSCPDLFYNQDLLFQEFFTGYIESLNLTIQLAAEEDLIANDDLRIFLNPPEIKFDPRTRKIFSNFCDQTLLQSISSRQKLFLFVKNNITLLDSHPELNPWYETTSRFMAYAEKNSSDLISPTHPKISNFLSALTQRKTFSDTHLQKINQMQDPNQQGYEIFQSLSFNLESTFSSPILHDFFIRHQTEIATSLEKNPSNPFLLQNALTSLKNMPQYTLELTTFYQGHSPAVTKCFQKNRNTGKSTIPPEQQLYLFLKAHPHILRQETTQNTPGKPLRTFMSQFSPIYKNACKNAKWTAPDNQAALRNCAHFNIGKESQDRTLMPFLRSKLNAFFQQHAALPAIKKIMHQALTEKGQGESSHVQTLATRFTPFSLCQAVWDGNMKADNTMVTTMKTNPSGFIGGEFVPPQPLNTGIHIMRCNNHFFSLLPKNLTPQ